MNATNNEEVPLKVQAVVTKQLKHQLQLKLQHSQLHNLHQHIL